MPFQSFVILAEMRTGSNFLEANLNAIPGVTCHGEAFNPHFIGQKGKDQLFGMTLKDRAADPSRFLRQMRERTEGLAGFRYFHDHDPRVFDLVMDDPACAKVVLTRNVLDSYISLKIARASDQWRISDTRNLKEARARFDPVEFTAMLEDRQAQQLRILSRLQKTGQTAFYIDYDDLLDLDVLNGLAGFLGVAGRLKALNLKYKKQNPEPALEKVSNPADMQAALARMDWFGLRSTPNFEPRRSGNVPAYVAVADAPLLFLPVKGGPEERVRTWMGRYGRLVGDFDRQGLRKWKQTHPGQRSFTVLRHPLARAHAAFDALLAEDPAELRTHLQRMHGLDLPPPGAGFATTGAYRAAFLTFLEFLRFLLDGRTDLRVSAAFASQSAILQGFAGLQAPDLVLREDRLEAGLRFLADETGLPFHDLPAAEERVGVPLFAVADAEVERAARRAYGRDYENFGFGDWRA
jgi:LPS sulfotransferase NodH